MAKTTSFLRKSLCEASMMREQKQYLESINSQKGSANCFQNFELAVAEGYLN